MRMSQSIARQIAALAALSRGRKANQGWVPRPSHSGRNARRMEERLPRNPRDGWLRMK